MKAEPSVTFVAAGTKGDVEPVVNLAREVASRGVRVVFASHARFAESVTGAGLAFEVLEGTDPRQVLEGEMLSNQASNPVSLGRRWRYAKRNFHPPTAVLRCYEELGSKAGLVVFGMLSWPMLHVAEQLGKKAVAANLAPFYPTGEFPAPVGPLGWHRRRHTTLVNRLGFLTMARYAWSCDQEWLNEWRMGQLGLGRIGFRQYRLKPGVPHLFGFSPAVLPKPADWPQEHQVTGYWFPPETAPRVGRSEVKDPAKTKTIYVYFGSNPLVTKNFYSEVLFPALEVTGCRAVLGEGWGEPTEGTNPLVIPKGDRSFEELLACAGVVMHHGGAGTCAAVLRRGLPSLVYPFFGEQKFWAARLERLGVCPPAVMHRQLTREMLIAQIKEMLANPAYARNAAALGEKIRGEDGTAVGAARIIELLKRGKQSGATGARKS